MTSIPKAPGLCPGFSSPQDLSQHFLQRLAVWTRARSETIEPRAEGCGLIVDRPSRTAQKAPCSGRIRQRFDRNVMLEAAAQRQNSRQANRVGIRWIVYLTVEIRCSRRRRDLRARYPGVAAEPTRCAEIASLARGAERIGRQSRTWSLLRSLVPPRRSADRGR